MKQRPKFKEQSSNVASPAAIILFGLCSLLFDISHETLDFALWSLKFASEL